MRVRRATRSDIPAMLEFHREASTSAWTRGHYESLFGTDAPVISTYLVLVVEYPSESRNIAGFTPTSQIVAHLVALRVDRDWELQYVVVSKKFRRRGIATLLLNELIEHARSKSAKAIFLEVRESNQSARALYRNAGFEETGFSKSYYSNPAENAILCQLKLY
jgi:[ribosomal protein S18]-alanine N-acetyltransferase